MTINTFFCLGLFLPFLLSPTTGTTQAFVSVLRRNTRTSSVAFLDTSEFARHYLLPPLGLFRNNKEIMNSLKRLEDKFGSIKDKLGSIEDKLESIEDGVGSIKVSLGKLETDVDWLKTLGTAYIGAFAAVVFVVVTNKGVLISALEALTKQ